MSKTARHRASTAGKSTTANTQPIKASSTHQNVTRTARDEQLTAVRVAFDHVLDVA